MEAAEKRDALFARSIGYGPAALLFSVCCLAGALPVPFFPSGASERALFLDLASCGGVAILLTGLLFASLRSWLLLGLVLIAVGVLCPSFPGILENAGWHRPLSEWFPGSRFFVLTFIALPAAVLAAVSCVGWFLCWRGTRGSE